MVRKASSEPAAVLTESDKINKDVTDKLMEFFEDKKNWGQNDVNHGRGWTLDELRIKSNTDLHKLWYILLKEKNMLLTMEYESKEEHRLFPSPERIDKVTKSMKNLEQVVRERNRAYYELETGITGERPGKLVTNVIGLNTYFRAAQHIIPSRLNQKWHKKLQHNGSGFAVFKFLKFYREKLWNAKRRQRNRDRNEVINLLKRNPNLDRRTLQTKFPEVNIERLEKIDAFKGHYVPKID